MNRVEVGSDERYECVLCSLIDSFGGGQLKPPVFGVYPQLSRELVVLVMSPSDLRSLNSDMAFN